MFARFMLAHLGDGAIGTERILRMATAEQMHARAFAHDPRLPGFALGFYEQSTHGLRIIGHGGNTQWFHSDVTLIPSERLGIFVSYNTDTGHELNGTAFLREFLDHYYPTTPAPPVVGTDQQQQARRVAGEYRFNRMSYTTFQRALGLISPVTVSIEADGSLLMDLTFIIITAVLMSNATSFMTGSSVAFELALAPPVVAAVLAVVAAVVAVRQWIDHVSLITSRLRYAAVVVTVLLFTWSLNE